ncbi:MAG: pentapeptide repeat-containing protein, partial [Litorivicinaceae bacterium]
LREADLQGATLRGADLWGADLREADLRCFGNMKEIKTMQIDRWEIGYTADTLQIGCQRHPIDKWRKWNTDAGRKWIEQMDNKALEWADRNLGLVLQMIDANPATPTGHEEK